MHPDRLTLADLLSTGQLAAGLVILVAVMLYLAVTGRLRRAFEFPPAPASTLTGAHLLLLLAAFFGVTFLVQMVLTAAQAPAPRMSATQTAPAQTQPEASADQPEPAEPPEPGDAPGDDSEPNPPDPAEPADTQPTPAHSVPSTQSSVLSPQSPPPSPEEEMQTLAVQAISETVLIAVILQFVNTTFVGGLAGFGLGARRLGRWLFWAIIGYLAFWPVCVGLATAVTSLLELLLPSWQPPEHKVLVFLQEPGVSVLWSVLAWSLAGLIAPAFEELMFRGLLLNWVRKVTGSAWLAILLSGVLFGVIHLPQWHLVPALTALGLMLGYLYARTGSLTLVVLFHAVFNLRTLVLLALADQSV